MARLLSRAFPPGLFLIGLGIVLIGLGAVLDHYNMNRTEWYAGEAGIVSLCTGSLLAFAAVLAILFGGDLTPEARPPEDADGDPDG